MSSRGSTLVLGKVSQLLDCIAANGEISPRDAADQIEEPASTVYRLLADLRKLDFVEPGSMKGTYTLGIKLFRLGARVADRLDVVKLAEPVLEELHTDTGETLFLCVRRNLDAVCVVKLDGIRVHSVFLQLGSSLPLHTGASPVALLAFEPESEWDAYAKNGGLRPFGHLEAPTPQELKSRMKETAARGYAVSDEDVNPGIGAIAAPIYDHSGGVAASISISGVRQAILESNQDETARQLLAASAEISHRMGYDPDAQR